VSEFIFTTHAKERLQLRKISQAEAELALRKPDKTLPGKKPNSIKFVRTLKGRQLQLVGTYLADQDKWLIVSAWVRGEDDPVPFVWQILTFPFRFCWWLIRKIFRW
jgi:hypothetical protein